MPSHKLEEKNPRTDLDDGEKSPSSALFSSMIVIRTQVPSAGGMKEARSHFSTAKKLGRTKGQVATPTNTYPAPSPDSSLASLAWGAAPLRHSGEWPAAAAPSGAEGAVSAPPPSYSQVSHPLVQKAAAPTDDVTEGDGHTDSICGGGRRRG